VIDSAGGMKVLAGGDITVDGGGNIIITPETASSGIVFNMGTGSDATLFEANPLGNNFSIRPNADGIGNLVVGQTSAPLDARWANIVIKSKESQDFYSYYDADHYSRIQMASGAASGYMALAVKDGSTHLRTIKFDADPTFGVFRPEPSQTTNLGDSTYLWNQGWFGDYLIAYGGIHVGGSSDPGTDNLIVDGATAITGAFGCNAAIPQTEYSSGGALNYSYVSTDGAYGFKDHATKMEVVDLLVAIRAALVANGIMS